MKSENTDILLSEISRVFEQLNTLPLRKNYMKINYIAKVTCIATMVFLMLGNLNAQIQLSENFDTGNSIPTSSSNAPSVPTDYTTLSGVWTLFKSYRHQTYYSPNYGIRLLKNIDDPAFIITPTLNTAGSISFWAYGSVSKPLIIYKTTNDGATWDSVGAIFSGAGVYEHGSVTVNDLSENIRLKIENGTVSINDLNIDNVVVTSYTTDPVITLSVSSLPGFGSVAAGESSASADYSVSAINLNAGLDITAPADFEVSLDNIIFSGSLTIPMSGGSVPETTVYTRFSPGAAIGDVSGLIAHSSNGAETENISVNGTAIASEPLQQSSVSFGTITGYTIEVNFTGGDGDRRIVVARESNPVSWVPSDGSQVTGVDSDFSQAVNQGGGNKVVYDGTGSSVNVTGLTGNTTYHFAVYEYNIGTNNSQNYNTASPGTGNQTTSPVPVIIVNPSSLSFGNVVINTTSVEKTYSLSANTLEPAAGIINVAAPDNFQVSLTSGSGFSSSVDIPYSNGELQTVIVYVRFSPSEVTPYSGYIVNEGGNAPAVNVSVSGNGVSPAEPNVFQAEDGILNRAFVQNEHSGYTGSGYVSLVGRAGAYIEVIFCRETAATDTVAIRYANGSGGTRTLTVDLNEINLGNVSFPHTSAWTNWSTVNYIVSFHEGINRLRFRTTSTSTFPIFDKFTIGGQPAIPVFKLKLIASGNGSVSANPSEVYYDDGEEVIFNAVPSVGSMFTRWFGAFESSQSTYQHVMNAHATVVGVFMNSNIPVPFPYEPGPRGFASVNNFGQSGTTGGEGGISMIIDNIADLWYTMLDRQDPNNVRNLPPLTVYLVGILNPDPGVFGSSVMLDVKDLYDVSIIGVGSNATITGFGLKIFKAKNVIVRNITFASCPDDAIAVDANDNPELGHHIWIDHCTFTEIPPPGYPSFSSYDGALDITHTASNVTVSWNHFKNYDKNSLVGHSNTQVTDTAMYITYHHNYFDSTRQRNPRVRFAKVHIFNNYYRSNALYGVSSNMGAEIMVEGNYFENVIIPTETSRDGSPPGFLVERDNIFINCGTPGTGGTVFEPSTFYNYTLESASSIPGLVQQYGGAGLYDFSRTDHTPIPVELASFNASVNGNDVQLNWITSTEINNFGFEVERSQKSKVKSQNWERIGFVEGGGTTTEIRTYSFTDMNVSSGQYSYRLKQIDYDGSFKYSPVVQVEVGEVINNFALHQNYPNPFNPETIIRFEIPSEEFVNISVFNVIGEQVASLVNEKLSGGTHSVSFNGNNLSSGLYIYRLKAGNTMIVRKMMLLK
jgi:pectate lyase